MQAKQPEQWPSSLKQAPSCLKQALGHFSASENQGLPMLQASVILGVVCCTCSCPIMPWGEQAHDTIPRLPEGKQTEATSYKPLNSRQADIQAPVFFNTSLGSSLNCCPPGCVESLNWTREWTCPTSIPGLVYVIQQLLVEWTNVLLLS